MSALFTPVEAENMDYLRRRVSRVAWISALTTFLFVLSQLAFFVERGWSDLYAHSSISVSLGGGVWLTWMWMLTRKEGQSELRVRTVETVGVIGACAFFTAAFFDVPLTLRPELLATYILTCALAIRAAIIPSSKLRTFVVSLVVGVLLAAFVYIRYSDYPGQPSPDPFETFLHTQWGVVANVGTLWAISVGACVSISGVVYGLQKEIHRHKRLGQYQLFEKLGEGGMGVVYKAQHALLKRPTAVKLLLPEKISASALARFEREVQLAAKLSHPNTVTVYDYGHSPDGIFYFAMELLDGESAQDTVLRWGPLAPERVVYLLAQVARALHEAHSVGLIHRDVTPANIMICHYAGEFDVAKVVDFGLARETDPAADTRLSVAGEITGTPQYMAPECLTSPDLADGRCDVYSLGAVAYFLLTGQHAFTGSSVLEVCSKQLLDQAPSARSLRDDVPESLELLIQDCLSKDVEGRPRDGAEVAMRLEACRGLAPWTALDASSWWRTRDSVVEPTPSVIPRTLHVRLPEVGE